MRFIKLLCAAAAVGALAACSSVNTKLVHDTVLPEYSPAANMGDVLDVWAACKKGSQKWTETKDNQSIVVRFECTAQDMLTLNKTVLDNSKTIKRMRHLFEFETIKYRAEFLVNADNTGFTVKGLYNDFVWKDGKRQQPTPTSCSLPTTARLPPIRCKAPIPPKNLPTQPSATPRFSVRPTLKCGKDNNKPRLSPRSFPFSGFLLPYKAFQ